ncbi:hypothetical protein HF086_007128 [Spodoptera exigua]|uniref:Cyclic nucleotide-binding domain-containing protein n=1 Tax=Spodoptera exigua TaxID=7107 RepID=A0A922MGA7_SPOEX|nr:hypothetical protein HF086_007128 [Spodoptera exigua]
MKVLNLVTGATDGIGKQYALELARRGISVVIISRNPDKLRAVASEIERTHNVKSKVVVADFSKGAEVYPYIEEQLKDIPIGILVNNVGVNYDYPMPLCEASPTKLWELINVNVGAVTAMCRLVLPGMVQRGRGAIVNSYVRSFTYAVREEYAPKGIHIQHLAPLFVSTKINAFSQRLMDGNLLVPDAATYSRYAVSTLGRQHNTTGYWLHGIQIEPSYYIVQSNPTNTTANDSNQTNTTTIRLNTIGGDSGNPAGEFLTAVYTISKMFIPIGPSSHPDNDIKRIFCLMIMVSGCLVVTGAAVASLSLIISLYMRPEETFRSRYRLIMKEMTDTKVPPALREKVESFYKMYWHKQRAVSKTRLLPTFPPTLPATINLDIYFEATQKTRILRDLPHQMLSELAKKMMTIHYIPGDAIIKRGSKKCRIIYITYGDVEMLTAEDDTTAILRLTRGTILTPCGGAVAEALTSSHLAVRAATFCTAHVLKASEMWRIVCKYSVAQDHAGPILASFTVQHKSSILQFNRNLLALKTMKDSQGVSLLASPDIFLEIAGCYIMRNAHPYHLIFKSAVSMEFRFFDFAMTIVYVLDHIVYLSTGANVEEGVPITFAQTSSKQMRSHWFVLNVVATLPIFEFVGDGHFAGINKLLSLPKVRANYCLVTNFTHSPFWEEKPLDDETISSRLIFGLYWAISMINFTNHRQTWAATEWKHVIYTLFILEICIVLRIFMEAVYSATIMVTTAPRENYSARIETVKSFLVRNEVDPQLRKRFITYLELCWYTDKIVNKEDLKVVTASVKMFYTSPNEILLHTGELTNEIYIIKSGICEILDPATETCIGHLVTKTHFGALICLLRLPSYYTIRAITHVHVMCIHRKVLGKVLSTPQINQALNYLKTTPVR